MKAKNFVKRGAKSYETVYVMASVVQLSYIDSLIETACVPDYEYRWLKLRANQELTEGEAEELINELLDKQRNPILGGFNYQQRDILKMLKLL